MKICLIMPLDTHSPNLAKLSIGEIMEPMGLAYLASAIRKVGHEVCIIDRRILFIESEYDLDKLNNKVMETIKKFNPDILGFHLNIVMVKDVKNFTQILRESLPLAKIVIGGPHVTLFKEQIFNIIPSVDIIIRGEGEMSFIDIANEKQLEEILGISYRTNDGIKVNNNRPLISSLDILTLPARDLLDTSFYFNPYKNILVDYSRSFHGQNPLMGEILTSRGCPMQCNFCAGHTIWEKSVRFHSESWVIQDILDVVSRGANFIYFNDDVFTVSRKRVFQLCNAIIKSGLNKEIQWVAQSRPEHMDKEVALIMKEAGCVRVEYGFESGSQRILNLMNKGTSISQYIKVVELTKQVGLNIQANIIFGYPGETEYDVNETIDFLKKIDVESVLLNAFQAIPGTKTYEKLKSENYVLNDSFIPSHPYLTPYNFTEMDNKKYEEMFWKMMKLCPEAYKYWEENKELFSEVAIEMGSVFAPKSNLVICQEQKLNK